MTIRCIIWGLETSHTSSALLNLRSEKAIDICAWFGDKKHGNFVTHHIYDFQGKSKKIRSTSYKRIRNTSYESLFAKAAPQFLEVTSRSYQTDVKSFQDLVDIFSCHINYLESMIIELKPDLVLFHNIPHEGPDLILYELALAHGLRTLICTQSLFENRFFLISRIEEIGKIDSELNDVNYQAPIIERKFEKDFFYMAKQKISERIRRKIANFFWASKIILSMFSVFGFVNCRRYFYRYFFWLDFTINRGRIANNQISTDVKYVYFPLHLQPEMTTSSLGGIYCDQLLAVERLRDLIPEDWIIILKENPKQSYFRRGNHFFDRLRRLNKVQYCTQGNTHNLIRHSQFVATISGSAGWEALCGGKNVLLFGNSWYQNLPGAFKYSKDLSLQDLTEFRIELKDLQKSFNKLMAGTFPGIVDPAYIAMLSSYDLAENNAFIQQALATHIQTI